MPISLDTLLFWCGLALLCVGLFVFLTGKKASDESKKESNRFEAFGIKIDVNNPSLILIMLGVVMMLSPKFIPQEVKQAASPDITLEKPSQTPPPAVEQPSPPVESSPLVMESASASKTPPETATSVSPPAPETALPAPTVESNKVVVTSESPKSGPSKAVPTPTPAQVAPKPKAQPPRQVATARPTPDNSEAAPKPKPQPEPIAPQETVASQPPPSPAMVVAVVADVSDRAGIRESAEAYARRASGEITQRAGEIFDKDRVVDNGTLADLRDHLQTGEEDYAGLCQKWQADILILGDFRIVTGYSTIDSAYWPDYHLHLYNCGTQRSNHEVFKHLNPSNQDSFPFEQAINQKTMKFLTDSRWVVGS